MSSPALSNQETRPQESTQQQQKQQPQQSLQKQSKKGKKRNNKGITNGGVKITPEYIAEQRRLAKIRKEKKALEDLKKPKEVPKDLQFIKRPILPLDNSKDGEQNVQNGGAAKKQRLSIMTYNLLAQALIRRSLFPTSGEALKWSKRSKVLLSELEFYHSDVMCLQEVDDIQFKSFWAAEFEKSGYYYEFHKFPKKNHGVAIVYSRKIFKKCDTIKYINYDESETAVKPRTVTRNVGMILKLEFNDEILDTASRKGLVIGTHHLFWHPHGTFERTRQTYVTLKEFREFMAEQKLDFKKWYKFFCGDFNSQQYHSPYLSMTRKPVYYDGDAQRVIEESVRQVFDDGPDEEAQEETAATADAQTIDPNEKSVNLATQEGREEEKQEQEQEQEAPAKRGYTAAAEGAPKGVPTIVCDSNNEELIQDLIKIHNDLPMRAISLYSVSYKNVHPENSLYRNEPDFSNWAHTWRGLLDYIFVVTEWDGENKHEVDSRDELAANEGVAIRGLLRMPSRSEMSEKGQPQAGEYGSDHLCMVAEVDLV